MNKKANILFLTLGFLLLFMGEYVSAQATPHAAITCNGSTDICNIQSGSSANIVWSCTNATSGNVTDQLNNQIFAGMSGASALTSVTSSTVLFANCSSGGVTNSYNVVVNVLNGTPTDTTSPIVSQFDVTDITPGQKQVTWSLGDSGGSHLAGFSADYAPYNAVNCMKTDMTGCVWSLAFYQASLPNRDFWSSSVYFYPPVPGQYTFRIIVYDAAGNQAIYPVPPPTVSVTCNGSLSQCTIPYGGSATIAWNTTDATSCSVSPGGASGVSGSFNTGGLTSTQVYSVNCIGGGGNASGGVQVNVSAAPPASCAASFSPASIISGQSSALTWSSNNDADGTLQYACTGNIGSGSTVANSTTSVIPTASQTCTFTVVNISGNPSTCSASVTVNPVPPVANIVCNGSVGACSAAYGSSPSISWTCINSTTASVTNTYNSTVWTNLNDAQVVNSVTTSGTFNLTCNGPGGVARQSVTVNVGAAPQPSCTVSFTPTSIILGQSTIMTWSSLNDADGTLQYVCNGNIGSGNTTSTGTSTVTPNLSQSCVLTATNVAGTSVNCSAPIVVVIPTPTPTPTPSPTPTPVPTPPPTPVPTCVPCNPSAGCFYQGRTCQACGTLICPTPVPTPIPTPVPTPQSAGAPYTFEIQNPFSGGISTLDDLFGAIAAFLYYIVGPIIVMMIVIAGLMLLFGRGEPEKVRTAKKILLWAIIGLVIIIIGQGFKTLLENILSLGG